MKFRIVFTCLFLIILVRSVPAGELIKIHIADRVYLRDGSGALRNIAQIRGRNEERKRKLEKIFVTRIPAPGQFVRLSRKMLRARILRAGFSTTEFVLEMPRNTRIYSAFSILSGRDIEKAAEKYLKKKGIWTPGMRVCRDSASSSVKMPSGELSYKCGASGEDPDTGRVNVSVKVMVNGKTEKSKKVSFRKKKVRQTTRDIPEIPEKKQKISNKRSKRVRVRRGDPLKLRFVRKNLLIVVPGVAAESGYTGDRIRVFVEKKRKIFNAVLESGSTALVEL